MPCVLQASLAPLLSPLPPLTPVVIAPPQDSTSGYKRYFNDVAGFFLAEDTVLSTTSGAARLDTEPPIVSAARLSSQCSHS